MFPGPSALPCPGALASWKAPGPDLANWESLFGNIAALHQLQDVNTVELWHPSRVLGKEAPANQGSGQLGIYLSVHLVLRWTLPMSVLKESPGKAGVPPSHLSKKGSSSGSPTLGPAHFYLTF